MSQAALVIGNDASSLKLREALMMLHKQRVSCHSSTPPTPGATNDNALANKNDADDGWRL